jgi:repressor LexA
MEKLSSRQQEVYNFIRQYCAENGFSPSLADVAKAIGLHESTAATYVAILKQKGFVKSEYRVARSLRVVEQGAV